MDIDCPICGKARKLPMRWGLRPIANCASCAQKLLHREGARDENGFKKCTICKQWKDTSEYTKNKARWDGLETYCRQCNTEKVRSYRERNQHKCNQYLYKSMRNHPKECNARALAHSFYPERQICSIVGCKQIGERHHPDYNKPKEIIWLCKTHHLH